MMTKGIMCWERRSVKLANLKGIQNEDLIKEQKQYETNKFRPHNRNEKNISKKE